MLLFNLVTPKTLPPQHTLEKLVTRYFSVLFSYEVFKIRYFTLTAYVTSDTQARGSCLHSAG